MLWVFLKFSMLLFGVIVHVAAQVTLRLFQTLQGNLVAEAQMPGLPFGFSFSGFVWVIAIIIVLGIIWRGRTKFVSGTQIVLKKFHIDDDPSAKIAVEITGRASGIVAWILNLLKLEPDIELVVTDSDVTIHTASLSGIQHILVPLNKVTASVCGYQRSILAFGFAVLFSLGFVLSLLSGFFENNPNNIVLDMGRAFGFLIWAGISALVFFLSKRVVISVESMHTHGVVFKRSVIENVSVDLPEAMRAIAVINARVLASQTTLSGSSGTPLPPPKPASMPPTGREPGKCPRCSTVNPTGVRFCENCGSPLSV